MDLNNKKILVTGATGFIGANLLHHLANLGLKPYVMLRNKSNTWRINDIINGLRLSNVDISDREAVTSAIKEIKPHVIFHMATYGGYVTQIDHDLTVRTNYLGTVNLLNACKASGFELFINTGSSSEYGIKSDPMKETDALDPVTEYGAIKAAASLYCQAMAKKEALPVVTLRIFSPYGYFEGPERLIPSVIRSCLRGEDPKLSNVESVRDFIFIEDVIDAFMKVINAKERAIGEVFNVGGGIQYSVGDVVNNIISLTGANVTPCWGSVPNPRNEPKCWQADILKAKIELKWSPVIPLTEGLKKTILWFRKNEVLYK